MMRARWISLWPLSLVACLSVLLVLSSRAEEPLPMGTLSGRLVDPSGNPVAGARIWADARDAESKSKSNSVRTLVEARTDAEGHFRLGPVEPVYGLHLPYPIRIEAKGLVGPRITSGHLTVFPGRDLDLGTIRLHRGRVFTGQVLDVDGAPRAGAVVIVGCQCFQLGHTLAGPIASAVLTTDAEGRFRTPPLPVGHLSLGVRVPDRQMAYAPSRPIPPGGEEDLGAIQLTKDVPLMVITRDEEGQPVAGVNVGSNRGTTDTDGRATIRGLGADLRMQLQARKEGYIFINWSVRRTKDGLYWRTVGEDGPESGPFANLVVPMKRGGWIEGQAIDAETGAPVRLNRVVVCNFERRPSGEVVLSGCQSQFEQTEPGRFRASYPAPDEYHLTFSAPGYHDAEAYTPKVTELKTIEGMVARLRKKTEGSAPTIARQTITGKVTRQGSPVRSGWVALWSLRRPANAPNSPVMRQRTVVGDPLISASAPIRDGVYSLQVPFQKDDWYVVAEEPGYPLTQVGPIAIALNETKSIDIACTDGGRIRGRVLGVPPGWEGHLWVVAFSKTAVHSEAQVDPDGTFSLPPVAPGEYGLKVGHNAYEDAEVAFGSRIQDHPEAFQVTADPWKRAKVVRVEAGQDTVGVEVEMPQ